MKAYLLVITVFFAGLAQASMEGCYLTQKLNGETVAQGPVENSLTRIYRIENEFYSDLASGAQLHTYVVSIFAGFDGQWSHFQNALLFEELGSWQLTPTSWQHEGEYAVNYRDSFYRLKKVHFATLAMLDRQPGGEVHGIVTQRSRELGRDLKLAFELRPIPCPD